MADQNQQNPPIGSTPQKPVSTAGPPPLNLPTKDSLISNSPSNIFVLNIKPPAPFIPKPSQPISQALPPSTQGGSFSPSQMAKPVPPPVPPALVPSPRPFVTPPPAVVLPNQTSQALNQPVKSSIRTMEDDLGALKKGQLPVGFGVQKQLESAPLPSGAPVSPLTPKITIPPVVGLPKTPSPNFPPSVGSRPITPFPLPDQKGSLPPKPVSDPFANSPISVPPSSKSKLSPTTLILLALALGIIGFSVWFFVFYKPATPNVSDSPTPIVTSIPIAAPLPPLETVFLKVESVVSPLSDDFFNNFQIQVDAKQLTIREPALYKVGDSSTSVRYSLSNFSAGTLMNVPASLISAVEDGDLYVTLMPKTIGGVSYGLIIKTKAPVDVNMALKDWEKILSSDLDKLFNINSAKAGFTGFKENNVSYPGVVVHYRNFPDPNLTIDYATVSAPNGENYFVFTNSREHIFSIIERIQTISPSGTPSLSPSPSI